jgi:sulfate adenylyltransferase
MVPAESLPELLAHAKTLPTVRLSERAICDFELLAVGAFSPLERFMGKQDYDRVVTEMRLSDGHLFPIPITLSVSNDDPVKLDREVTLVDSRNEILAVMTIEEIYDWDLATTAREVFGTTD